MSKSPICLHIFRKDLRIHDNSALYAVASAATSYTIMPIFVFVSAQIDPKLNSYHCNNLLGFMHESLNELNELTGGNLATPLVATNENLRELLDDVLALNDISAISFNLDYTPYGRDRDERLIKYCASRNPQITCITAHDLCLKPIGATKLYRKFTPFLNTYDRLRVATIEMPRLKFTKCKLSAGYNFALHNLSDYYVDNPKRLVRGGVAAALARKARIDAINYAQNRNSPAHESTRLGAYLRFGCLSAREVYILAPAALRNELVWRDFYYQLIYYLGYSILAKRVQITRKPRGRITAKLTTNYTQITHIDATYWQRRVGGAAAMRLFELWKTGRTGYPIVDAGMRELAATGFMHNRLRMITADFLVKLLNINWTIGEQWFAQNLTDYDIQANAGNWLWIVGAAWGQPKFRIFNPYEQNRKYDAECDYVKRWVPELANLTVNEILALYHDATVKPADYPAMCVDYAAARDHYLGTL
ncbi:deoxyribodipyrimidine photolyase [Faustovirus]|nr:deoxyribodipyrimidine photolyase [Faustovirus]AMN84462.1 deoxyribodipyrimidine photolyase [Faustovirus]AMP44396.1 deoxyribodipyrimidine photolyase [Faustovirus]